MSLSLARTLALGLSLSAVACSSGLAAQPPEYQQRGLRVDGTPSGDGELTLSSKSKGMGPEYADVRYISAFCDLVNLKNSPQGVKVQLTTPQYDNGNDKITLLMLPSMPTLYVGSTSPYLHVISGQPVHIHVENSGDGSAQCEVSFFYDDIFPN